MADWWKPDADTRRALRRWDKVKPVRREVVRWEVVEPETQNPAEAGSAGLDDRASEGHAASAKSQRV